MSKIDPVVVINGNWYSTGTLTLELGHGWTLTVDMLPEPILLPGDTARVRVMLPGGICRGTGMVTQLIAARGHSRLTIEGSQPLLHIGEPQPGTPPIGQLDSAPDQRGR